MVTGVGLPRGDGFINREEMAIALHSSCSPAAPTLLPDTAPPPRTCIDARSSCSAALAWAGFWTRYTCSVGQKVWKWLWTKSVDGVDRSAGRLLEKIDQQG